MSKTVYKIYGIGISHEHRDVYRSRRERSVAEVRLQVGKRATMEFIDLDVRELARLVEDGAHILSLLIDQQIEARDRS